MFLFGALFAVGLGFTACSSDKDDGQETSINILDKFDVNGRAQVNVALYTPTASSSTRTGTENDQFPTTYVENEYIIKNAILILFTGTLADEDNALFQGAYTLTGINGSANIANNIEQVYTAYISNENVHAGSGLLALVVANNNSTLTVNASDNTLTVTTSGGAVKPTKGVTKFSEFRAYELAPDKLGDVDGTNGLYMTNAPLATVYNTKNESTKPSAQSSAATPIVRTLAEVDPSKIFSSSSSATTDPAITVYLERAAAKVEVTQNITNQYLENNSAATFTATNITWLVDNTEPTFFAVRNPGDFATYKDYTNQYLPSSAKSYRFFGANPELSGGSLYRTYWAVDPHYTYTYNYDDATPTAETALSKETTLANINKALSTTSTGVYQYITENTFNEYGLSKDKTTRVLLAITFNGGTGFYTIGKGDVIYTNAATGTNSIGEKIKEYLLTLPSITAIVGVAESDIDVTLPASPSAGEITTGFSLAVSSSSSLDDTKKSSLSTALSGANIYTGLGGFTFYADGKAYYQARIKHFGDEETPLKSPADGSTYKLLYCNNTTTASASDFLGRYSVVRNNWYVLNITSVKHLGSATIPTPDTTPDDEVDQYLGIKMYVVKWAKRFQDVAI